MTGKDKIASSKLPVPQFTGGKPYETFRSQIEMWARNVQLEKKAQAVQIAFSFEEGSKVHQKVWEETDAETLKKLETDDGIYTLLAILNKHLKNLNFGHT